MPPMRKAVFLALIFSAALAGASSHRDSPFIAKNPKVNGTNFYMFLSYQEGHADSLVLLADFQPWQPIHAGPMFYPLDPAALYEIHLDNNGDCREDLTFQFRFRHALLSKTITVGDKQIPTPFLYTGPVSAADSSHQNFFEQYTVSLARGGARSGQRTLLRHALTDETVFGKPMDYVGEKILGDTATYRDYVKNFFYPIGIPGCPRLGRVFVGQRDDHFNMDLGRIFDLFDTEIANPNNAHHSSLHSVGATTIALELPAACVLASTPVISGWSSASLRQARVLNPRPSFEAPNMEGGPWMRVSRVGNPLVNMMFIGLPDKNRFNAGPPDEDIRYLDYFTHPTLPVSIESQFGFTPPKPPRQDLVQLFLTGFPGLNATQGVCDALRLNTSYPSRPGPQQNRMGALHCFDPGPVFNPSRANCDPTGFPNGRRPGDDVMDFILRASMGRLLPSSEAPDGGLSYNDGVWTSQQFFFQGFPYLATPHGPHNEEPAQ